MSFHHICQMQSGGWFITHVDRSGFSWLWHEVWGRYHWSRVTRGGHAEEPVVLPGMCTAAYAVQVGLPACLGGLLLFRKVELRVCSHWTMSGIPPGRGGQWRFESQTTVLSAWLALFFSKKLLRWMNHEMPECHISASRALGIRGGGSHNTHSIVFA